VKVKKIIRLLSLDVPPKRVAFSFVLVIMVLFLVLLFLWYTNGGLANIITRIIKPGSDINGIILFEGANCPQCVKVEDFISTNHLENRIAFTRLEVFNNAKNAGILADKAQTCGLDPKQLGVPFVWDGKNCIIGYVDVIEFFKKATTPKKP